MLGHEAIVVEMRVSGVHAVDLFHLAGAETSRADSRHHMPLSKPLAAEDFVEPGNAAGKAVGRVE